jgi:hypothetical protein
MVTVMMMVGLGGGEGWTGQHHQEQDSGKNLFHGTNVARKRPRRKRFEGRASKKETGKPEPEWTYRAKEGRSKSRNTPFDGWTMQGKVRWTISEGRVAYSNPR